MKKLKEYAKYIPVFILGVVIIAFITEFDKTMATFQKVFGYLGFLIGRFAIGFGLAYFLNLIMRFFERKLKFKRVFSLITTYALFLGFLGLMGWLVIPAVAESVKGISTSVTTYYSKVMELLDGVLDQLTPEAAAMAADAIRNVVDTTTLFLRQLLSWDFLGGTLGSAGRSILNVAFGFLISMYALWDKDKLRNGAKRFVNSITSDHVGKITLRLAHDADHYFSKYIVGKSLDSLLVGVVSLVLFLVFGLPVAPFLAVVVMVTNLIPYFGPIIGGVICAVVLMGFDPMYALIGLLIVIGVQILDGSFIEPVIVGDSVDLSPLLTLVVITIGGDLFGVFGMFFAAPVVGTLKNILTEVMDARLKFKNGESGDEDEQKETPQAIEQPEE
ncbi:transporter [Clostridia bacterium]|nr:transporter [Clostridia bacterium]